MNAFEKTMREQIADLQKLIDREIRTAMRARWQWWVFAAVLVILQLPLISVDFYRHKYVAGGADVLSMIGLTAVIWWINSNRISNSRYWKRNWARHRADFEKILGEYLELKKRWSE